MEKEKPFKGATGQVERSTEDLSEREQAKSRQADLSEKGVGEPDAEGEAVPTRGADADEEEREAAGDPGNRVRREPAPEPDDDAERSSSRAKPIAALNHE